MQSITQSLRSNAGKNFELIIERLFKNYNINYD